MSADLADGDELVGFLLRETGEHLQVVIEYDADCWEPLYLSPIAETLIEEAGPAINELLDAFRREGERNTNLGTVFELNGYYCSLHLFDRLVLLHFGNADGEGVVFGYDPAAASHLTAFVAETLPYIRCAGIDGFERTPSWT